MRLAAALAWVLAVAACTGLGTGDDIEGTWLYESYTGYDPERNPLAVVAFQNGDPFPNRVYTCP